MRLGVALRHTLLALRACALGGAPALGVLLLPLRPQRENIWHHAVLRLAVDDGDNQGVEAIRRNKRVAVLSVRHFCQKAFTTTPL